MNNREFRKITVIRIISVILITSLLLVLYGLKIKKDKPSNSDWVSAKSYANSIVNEGIKSKKYDSEKFEVITARNNISDSEPAILVVIRINNKDFSWDGSFEFESTGNLRDCSLELTDKFQTWLVAVVVCLLFSILLVELGYRFYKNKSFFKKK